MKFTTAATLFAVAVIGGTSVLANESFEFEARDVQDLLEREDWVALEARRGGGGGMAGGSHRSHHHTEIHHPDIDARDFDDIQELSAREPRRGRRGGRGGRRNKGYSPSPEQSETPSERRDLDAVELEAREFYEDNELEAREPHRGRGGRGGGGGRRGHRGHRRHGGRKGRGGRGGRQQATEAAAAPPAEAPPAEAAPAVEGREFDDFELEARRINEFEDLLTRYYEDNEEMN